MASLDIDGRQYNITRNDCYIVGSKDQCDIKLYNASLDEKHALIIFTNDDELHLIDLHSNNGCFVDGLRVPKQRIISAKSEKVFFLGFGQIVGRLKFTKFIEENNKQQQQQQQQQIDGNRINENNRYLSFDESSNFLPSTVSHLKPSRQQRLSDSFCIPETQVIDITSNSNTASAIGETSLVDKNSNFHTKSDFNLNDSICSDDFIIPETQEEVFIDGHRICSLNEVQPLSPLLEHCDDESLGEESQLRICTQDYNHFHEDSGMSTESDKLLSTAELPFLNNSIIDGNQTNQDLDLELCTFSWLEDNKKCDKIDERNNNNTPDLQMSQITTKNENLAEKTIINKEDIRLRCTPDIFDLTEEPNSGNATLTALDETILKNISIANNDEEFIETQLLDVEIQDGNITTNTTPITENKLIFQIASEPLKDNIATTIKKNPLHQNPIDIEDFTLTQPYVYKDLQKSENPLNIKKKEDHRKTSKQISNYKDDNDTDVMETQPYCAFSSNKKTASLLNTDLMETQPYCAFSSNKKTASILNTDLMETQPYCVKETSKHTRNATQSEMNRSAMQYTSKALAAESDTMHTQIPTDLQTLKIPSKNAAAEKDESNKTAKQSSKNAFTTDSDTDSDFDISTILDQPYFQTADPMKLSENTKVTKKQDLNIAVNRMVADFNYYDIEDMMPTQPYCVFKNTSASPMSRETISPVNSVSSVCNDDLLVTPEIIKEKLSWIDHYKDDIENDNEKNNFDDDSLSSESERYDSNRGPSEEYKKRQFKISFGQKTPDSISKKWRECTEKRNQNKIRRNLRKNLDNSQEVDKEVKKKFHFCTEFLKVFETSLDKETFDKSYDDNTRMHITNWIQEANSSESSDAEEQLDCPINKNIRKVKQKENKEQKYRGKESKDEVDKNQKKSLQKSTSKRCLRSDGEIYLPSKKGKEEEYLLDDKKTNNKKSKRKAEKKATNPIAALPLNMEMETDENQKEKKKTSTVKLRSKPKSENLDFINSALVESRSRKSEILTSNILPLKTNEKPTISSVRIPNSPKKGSKRGIQSQYFESECSLKAVESTVDRKSRSKTLKESHANSVINTEHAPKKRKIISKTNSEKEATNPIAALPLNMKMVTEENQEEKKKASTVKLRSKPKSQNLDLINSAFVESRSRKSEILTSNTLPLKANEKPTMSSVRIPNSPKKGSKRGIQSQNLESEYSPKPLEPTVDRKSRSKTLREVKHANSTVNTQHNPIKRKIISKSDKSSGKSEKDCIAKTTESETISESSSIENKYRSSTSVHSSEQSTPTSSQESSKTREVRVLIKNLAPAISDVRETKYNRNNRTERKIQSCRITEKSIFNSSLVHSSSRERIRFEAGRKIRISFSTLDADYYDPIVAGIKNLVEIVKDPIDFDVLVMASTPTRTYKFLVAMAGGKFIVNPKWLDDVRKTKSTQISWKTHILDFKAYEKRYKFNYLNSLNTAQNQKILADYAFLSTNNVKPLPQQLKVLIQIAGGKFYEKLSDYKSSNKLFLLSIRDDEAYWQKYRRALKNIIIIDVDALMLAIMRQETTTLTSKEYILTK